MVTPQAPSPSPSLPSPRALHARLRQALLHAGQPQPDAREEAELALLFDHIQQQGNACGLAWLLDPLPAARAVCTHALLNDMLDVAATEVAGAPCVRVLLSRGADPVAERRTPTLMAVLNRLRFVLGSGSSSSTGCGAGAGGGAQANKQEEKAQRLLAVVEAMIRAMTPTQLNARDFRHFTPLSFAAFYALEKPARWLLCAGADPYCSLPFNHNAIEWCVWMWLHAPIS
jgi:hypothetical protein